MLEVFTDVVHVPCAVSGSVIFYEVQYSHSDPYSGVGCADLCIVAFMVNFLISFETC